MDLSGKFQLARVVLLRKLLGRFQRLEGGSTRMTEDSVTPNMSPFSDIENTEKESDTARSTTSSDNRTNSDALASPDHIVDSLMPDPSSGTPSFEVSTSEPLLFHNDTKRGDELQSSPRLNSYHTFPTTLEQSEGDDLSFQMPLSLLQMAPSTPQRPSWNERHASASFSVEDSSTQSELEPNLHFHLSGLQQLHTIAATPQRSVWHPNDSFSMYDNDSISIYSDEQMPLLSRREAIYKENTTFSSSKKRVKRSEEDSAAVHDELWNDMDDSSNTNIAAYLFRLFRLISKFLQTNPIATKVLAGSTIVVSIGGMLIATNCYTLLMAGFNLFFGWLVPIQYRKISNQRGKSTS